MYSLYALNQAHPCDVQDLLWVGFDAALSDDKTQQHAPRDPKNTFLRIEFDAIRSEFRKGLLKVSDQVISSFGFDYDVIDIGLNGSPDEVSEAIEHTALVHSPNVL